MIFKVIFISSIILISITSCQTFKKKSDEITNKETKKLEFLIGKSIQELKIKMGTPTLETTSDDGNQIIFYIEKKLGITCERKFEIDEASTVVGFTSKGCF